MVNAVLIVFLLSFLSVNVTHGVTVEISNDIIGTEGRNGTCLECTYDNEITYVRIMALINCTYTPVVGFVLDGVPVFFKYGYYLKGRVTFNNVTQSSRKAQMCFNELLCEDDGDYKCLVDFFSQDTQSPEKSMSPSTHISVKVLPVKPTSIGYLISANKGETTSEPLKRIDQTTLGGLTTTKTRQSDLTSSSQTNFNNNQIIEEDDIVTVLCEGNVGKPPGNLIVTKIRNNGEQSVIMVVDNFTREIPENCTFYQNNTFTVNVTAADNGAVFRCSVESHVNDVQMYIETEPIDVKYQVRVPDIKVYPASQENAPVTLSCFSTGNPLPEFTWYRIHNNSQSFQYFADTRNITLHVNDEGVYRCSVNNSIAGKVYVKGSQKYTLIFPATTKPTSPGISTPELPDNSKVQDRNKTYYLIGGVGGGILFITIITVVLVAKCRGQRKPRQHNDADDRLVHQLSKRHTLNADNYCSVSLGDNGNGRGSNGERNHSQEETRKHNDRYLKRQAELNAKTETQRDHNPNEYAMVNKPKKRGSSEQQEDTYQPTQYAQVNKVKKTSSSIQPNDEDHYASEQEGIYDHANNRRHKQHTASDPYDTPANINKNRFDTVGSVAENTGLQMKQKQVAKVKPSGRAGYENAGMVLDDVIKKNEEPNTAL